MKTMPIDFYKQFLYKTKPQMIVHFILIILILILLKLIFPEFKLIYLLYIFIISNLLNIINSKFMVLVDLYKPNLNWTEEYEAIKNNNNKIIQYSFTVLIILILIYFRKIFNEINLNYANILIILILSIFILISNKIIKVIINKLF